MEENVTFDKCMTMNYIKLVHKGTVHGREVFLKFAPQWFVEFDTVRRLHDQETQQPQQYESTILNEVRNHFGNGTHSEGLAETYISVADIDHDGHLSKAEGESLLALLTQQEPKMLIALNGSKHVASFHGYCGGLYAVDKVALLAGDLFGVWRMEDLSLVLAWCDPIKDVVSDTLLYLEEILSKHPYAIGVFDFFMTSFKHLANVRSPPTLEEMFLFVFQFLDMILELSSKPFGIMYSCDIHSWNYGLTENLTIKVIDLDLIFTESLLHSILSQKSCESHKHCKSGSNGLCMSPCNFDTGLCSPQPNTHDLQVFCTLFLSDLIVVAPDLTRISPKIIDCLEHGITNTAVLCSNLPRANSSHVLAANVDTVKAAVERVKKKCMNRKT